MNCLVEIRIRVRLLLINKKVTLHLMTAKLPLGRIRHFDKYYCGIYKLFVEDKIKIYTTSAISPNLVTQERI